MSRAPVINSEEAPRILNSARSAPETNTPARQPGAAVKSVFIGRRKDDREPIDNAQAIKESPTSPLAELTTDELLNKLQLQQIELQMRNESLHQKQIALDEARDRYLNFYQFAPVGYLSLSFDGIITGVNLAGSEQFLAEREKLLGSPFLGLLNPEHHARWLQVFLNARDAGERGSVDVAFLRHDGTLFNARIDCRRGTETVPELCITLTDINELKAAENQLRKLFLAIEQSSESIVISNHNAEIEYVNQAVVAATGYSRPEVIGQNLNFLQSDKTLPETLVSMWSALTQGLPWKGEIYNRRKDGSAFAELNRIAPLRQDDGTVSHYVAVKENITALKIANDRLATIAVEQNHAIESERRRLAREVHDQIGQALLGIKLIINTLPREMFPSGQDTAIAQALEAGITTARKITAELLPPLLDDLGLASALEHLLKNTLADGKLAFEVDIDAQAALNKSQALALFRIAQEAITNTIRHAGAAIVVISGRRDGNRYVFSIEDDGCGFARASARPGALGLISMRDRALLIGATWEIVTRLRGGTAVRVCLPLGNRLADEYPAA